MPVKYQLSLKEGSTPPSTDAPTALDELLTQIRQYTEVATNSDDPDSDKVRSILVQATTPTGANANDLWVQVNSITGRPLALKAYTGANWKPVNATNSGDSNSRPSDAEVGETYFDTDINVMLMYTGSGWVTQDGSPGDMKYVYIDSANYGTFALGKARAEALNPGWEYASDAEGSVLVATDGTGAPEYLTAGNTFGSKTHTLAADELPAHTHLLDEQGKPAVFWDAFVQEAGGDNNNTRGFAGGSASDFPFKSNTTGNNTTTGLGHENRQPSYTAFLMRKLGY
jgi:hypothetical protein